MSKAFAKGCHADFEVYAIGLVSASVCSSLSLRTVTRRLNADHPTGVRSRWALAKEPTFQDGTPNGAPCHRHPATHKHYLFHC